MLCIARTASCSPFTPASVQRNQLAVSGENPRLTAYSVPGQCICLIVADKNIVVRFRGLEGFRSKLPLVEEICDSAGFPRGMLRIGAVMFCKRGVHALSFN